MESRLISQVTIPRNLPPGPYFIGATAGGSTNFDSNGITVCLSLLKPTLLSPKNRGTNISSTPTLGWSDVNAASIYEVQVATDRGFTNVVATMTGLTGSQWTVTPALSSGAAYFWRVRAVNVCNSGPWSTLWSCKTL